MKSEHTDNKHKFLTSCHTYLLVIKLKESHSIRIGKPGVINFEAGFYYYTGSAKRTIASRILRHLRKEKKLHWHIDYLLNPAYSKTVEIWISNKINECELAYFLSKNCITSVTGFGCSDCKCNSHLFFNRENSMQRNLLIKAGLYRYL